MDRTYQPSNLSISELVNQIEDTYSQDSYVQELCKRIRLDPARRARELRTQVERLSRYAGTFSKTETEVFSQLSKLR